MGIKHTHDLDGQLHDGCPSCAYTRLKGQRLKAHKEVDNELKQLEETAYKANQYIKQERKK